MSTLAALVVLHTKTDKIMRKASDARTWIQYNTTQAVWQCCGDNGCNGTVTDETFAAVSPSDWTAVASTQTSTTSVSGSTISSSTTLSPAAPTLTTASPSSAGGSTGRGGMSTGAEAGIGVGCSVAGIATLAAIIFGVLWKRRRASQMAPKHDMGVSRQQMLQSSLYAYGGDELAGHKPVMSAQELSGIGPATSPQELANEGFRR